MVRIPLQVGHTVYWYADLTKYGNIKWIKIKKKSSKHSSHIYLLKLSSPGNIIYLIPALIRYLKYQLISCFHRALLQSITFIDRLNALDYTKLTG